MNETSDNRNLTFGYRLDATPPTSLSWGDVEHLTPADPTWLHLQRTSEPVRRWLHEKAGLEPIVVEALLDANSRPRIVVADHGLLATLRGVNVNPGADPEDMVSIRIWLDKNRIITLHRERVMAAGDVAESLHGETAAASDIFVRLARHLVTRVSPTMETLAETLDDLETGVVDPNRESGQDALTGLRIQILSLKRHLAPQREAMMTLSREPNGFFTNAQRAGLRESANRLTRYVEDLEAARERANIMQDEIARQLNEQLNRRMYAVTVVAGVFLPLSFLTGLLGINVGGIPGAEYRFGFVLATLIIGLIGVGTVVLFRWKKWI